MLDPMEITLLLLILSDIRRDLKDNQENIALDKLTKYIDYLEKENGS